MMTTYWVGDGHGQVGDEGAEYRRVRGRWQRRWHGYTIPIRGGARGWHVSRWEYCPADEVPRHIRAQAEEEE
jgi:hypothetical protein